MENERIAVECGREGTANRWLRGWMVPGTVFVLLGLLGVFLPGSGAFSQSPRNVGAETPLSGAAAAPTFLQIQPSPSNTEMIAVSTPCVSAESGEHYQQLILIDTKKKVICVYHVDAKLGQVSLQCVRPFQYDQELKQYYDRRYTGETVMPEYLRQTMEEGEDPSK